MGANPNTFSTSVASFAQYWSRRMQRTWDKIAVYRDIASFAEAENLKKGQRVHRPYGSDLTSNVMGADGSFTRQALTDADEYLDIDQERETSFYIKELDEIQHNYAVRNHYADKAATVLNEMIDGFAIKTGAAAAASTVDESDLGGTSGNGITPTTTNIAKIFGKANLKLDRYNIPQNDRWCIMSPDFFNVLWERLEGKDSQLGDEVGERNKLARGYAGFRLYKSNASYWTGKLLMGTNPTDGDTITINGVTLTFKATLGTTAGNIHICSDVENTINNLIDALETPGTSIDEATNAGYVAVSLANQKLLTGISCTDGATYVTVTAYGHSYMAVSETLTATADVWTPELQIQNILFGQGKPIDIVVQKNPNLKIQDRSGYVGKDFITWAAYGGKTFREGTFGLVNAKIRSDAF